MNCPQECHSMLKTSVLTTTYSGFFFSFLANFFLSQTTLSDARTPMLTTPPYPFLFSIPLSPSLRSMSDAVVLFDCLGKVQ